MKPKHLFFAVPAALLIFSPAAARASSTVDEKGALACVNDKWDEKEPEKGHKLVVYAGRCIKLPSAPNEPKVVEDCAGNYEYKPDGSWKGAGTCTRTYPGGDKMYETWEESSASKQWPYKTTGGTGKFKDASGGGTYYYDSLTDTLTAGAFSGKIVLP